MLGHAIHNGMSPLREAVIHGHCVAWGQHPVTVHRRIYGQQIRHQSFEEKKQPKKSSLFVRIVFVRSWGYNKDFVIYIIYTIEFIY